MYQLKIGNIPLPVIYVVERNEAFRARNLGVPYIVRPKGYDDEHIVKAFLYRKLYEKFPNVDWHSKLGIWRDPNLKVWVPKVVDVSSAYRETDGGIGNGAVSSSMEQSQDYRFTGGGSDEEMHCENITYERKAIDDWLEDRTWDVDIDTLQKLHLLPTFLDDVATAIKRNLVGLQWMDGWNKKLDCNLGRYDAGSEAPNLIVLDVSGSIPKGISGTMVSLIETLRTQANAALIITGRNSQYWEIGDKLPSPRQLAHLIGGCNERTQFYNILRTRVFGKHWGNVIVFGDNDAPSDARFDNLDRYRGSKIDKISDSEMASTRIDNLLAFHAYSKRVPGYGLWAEACTPKANVQIDTSWVHDL